tara:strand:- start:58 stop:594 length:537 start_codon:yes stop_codon:yes gene_type:complete
MIASYFTVTGVLTSKECQEIIDYCTDKCRSSDVTAPVSNESSIVKDVRNSLNTFISPDELPIIRKVIDCAVKVSSENFNFPMSTIEPIQYAEYTEGMYYNAHTDSGETLEHDRDISTSLFLSPRNEYEGGNLCIRYPNNWVEIDEQQGSMVVFSSMLVHKVKPVEKGKRSSLVMWCKR